jgi:DHA1 family inner membrane transport protein
VTNQPTDADSLSPAWIPFAPALFGLGMAVGNPLGGRVADSHDSLGLVGGFAGVLVLLVALNLWGQHVAVPLPALFGVGATMMFAIPTIQVRLTRLAPEAPTLMGAEPRVAQPRQLPRRAGGAVTINAGLGTLSTVWAGVVFTLAGLILFAVTQQFQRTPRLVPAQAS